MGSQFTMEKGNYLMTTSGKETKKKEKMLNTAEVGRK